MHLEHTRSTYKGNVYTSYRIARSVRKGEKVEKEVLFTLGALSPQQVKQIKLILRTLTSPDDVLVALEAGSVLYAYEWFCMAAFALRARTRVLAVNRAGKPQAVVREDAAPQQRCNRRMQQARRRHDECQHQHGKRRIPRPSFSIFKASGFERLWRDARLGKIHPTNPALTMELVGKITLGINPDESPRWG